MVATLSRHMRSRMEEFKASPMSIVALPEGVIEGYAAIFGNIDDAGDIIEPGAFTKCLQEHNTFPLCYWHDVKRPLGTAACHEDGVGLRFKAQVDLNTQQGREAYSGAKAGYLCGVSFMFVTYKSAQASVKGRAVRLLKEVGVKEITLATTGFQVNQLATVDTVKADAPMIRMVNSEHDQRHTNEDAIAMHQTPIRAKAGAVSMNTFTSEQTRVMRHAKYAKAIHPNGTGHGVNMDEAEHAMAQLKVVVVHGVNAGVKAAVTTAAWSGSAATQRVRAWATGGDGQVNWGKFGRAFLYHDPANSDKESGYKFPVMDVVGGQLKLIPRAVMAAAARLGSAKIPSAARSVLRSRINGLYKKINKPSPFKDGSKGVKAMARIESNTGSTDFNTNIHQELLEKQLWDQRYLYNDQLRETIDSALGDTSKSYDERLKLIATILEQFGMAMNSWATDYINAGLVEEQLIEDENAEEIEEEQDDDEEKASAGCLCEKCDETMASTGLKSLKSFTPVKNKQSSDADSADDTESNDAEDQMIGDGGGDTETNAVAPVDPTAIPLSAQKPCTKTDPKMGMVNGKGLKPAKGPADSMKLAGKCVKCGADVKSLTGDSPNGVPGYIFQPERVGGIVSHPAKSQPTSMKATATSTPEPDGTAAHSLHGAADQTHAETKATDLLVPISTDDMRELTTDELMQIGEMYELTGKRLALNYGMKAEEGESLELTTNELTNALNEVRQTQQLREENRLLRLKLQSP